MTIRALMIGVFLFVIGSILSIIVVQHFDQDQSANSTQPPDPLTVTPEKAAAETQ